MVLAPSVCTIALDDFAEMADRIMEVATLTVAAVQVPLASSPSTELESLRAEVRELHDMVKTFNHHL